MMALSVRHSPYTIPSPRFNSMSSPTCYNPHFSSGAGPVGVPGASVAAPPAAGPPTSYNVPSSSMLGLQSSMFSSMSPLATCGTTLQGNLNPSMNLLPTALNSSSSSVAVETSGPALGCLSDTSAPDHSPASCCSADSPTSPPDLSVEDPPSPYKSCGIAGCYSSLSPPSSPGVLPGSMLNGSRSPPPPPSLPLAGSSTLPGYPCTATPSSILPSPMYSSQDYPSSFSSFSSSAMPPSFSSSNMPSLSMPMWSPYPSLPNVGPLPSPSLPKLSYDSPRYKLTPERAIPLIKWFEEHKDHPYPTRHEKIILCQSTQLTFTQVSTWFANARRRMKKALSEEEESGSQSSGSNSDRENSPDCISNLRSLS